MSAGRLPCQIESLWREESAGPPLLREFLAAPVLPLQSRPEINSDRRDIFSSDEKALRILFFRLFVGLIYFISLLRV